MKSRRKDGPPARPEASTSPPTTEQRSTWRLLVAAAALAAAVILLYLPSLNGEFLTWDDGIYVSGNPYLRAVTWDNVKWAFFDAKFRASNWHPLTWLSHLLDTQVYGLERPWGHHLTSVLLHAANTVLLLALLWRLIRRFWVAVIVAALFALHPLRVEVVSWIAERKELLCASFSLLTLLAYTYYAARPAVWRYLLVAAAFAAALLAKPMAVTLPLVLLLLDWWPLGRLGWRAAVEKLPLLALSAGACAMTVYAQGAAKAPLEFVTYEGRVGNAITSYAAYLGKLFWPWPGTLLPFYTHPRDLYALVSARDLAWGVRPEALALSAALLSAMTLLALWQRRRRPYLLLAWLWYLGTLVPVIGLVQVGSQAMADRYTYIPLIGPVLALVLLAGEALGARLSRPLVVAAAAAAALVALLLAGLTFAQQAVWQNDLSLWGAAARGEPQSPVAHRRLGDALMAKTRLEDAVLEYRESIKCRPNYAEGHAALGLALAKLGQADEALQHCRAALAIVRGNKGLERQFDSAVALLKGQAAATAELHCQLGSALMALQRFDDAVQAFDDALRLAPENLVALNGRALALARKGRYPEAIEGFKKALAIEENYQEALSNLGNALVLAGQTDEAIVQLQRAVEIGPKDAEAHCNLGNALMQKKERLGEAVEHFARATELDPSMESAYAGWARAEVARGRPAQAVPLWEKVVELRPKLAAARLELARALRQAGRRDEALKKFQEALALQPNLAEAHREMAGLLDELGKHDEAARHRQLADRPPK